MTGTPIYNILNVYKLQTIFNLIVEELWPEQIWKTSQKTSEPLVKGTVLFYDVVKNH